MVTPDVTESACKLLHPMLQVSMIREQHPLWIFLQKRGTSLASFAREAKTSRMQLYRIMDGEGTTTSRLKQISDATKGELSVKDLVGGSRGASK